PSSALIAQAGRLDQGLLQTLRRDVLSHASVLTLDVAEAALLSGSTIEDEDSAVAACRRLRGEGRCAIHLVGRLGTGIGYDLLLDDDVVTLPATPRPSIDDADVFSAALTALLANGLDLQPAIAGGLRYRDGLIADESTDGTGVVVPGGRRALETESRAKSDEP
ncbi:MAG: hydroxymethylpyrimidine/phosphomethylpyrimidine kinase, partial [Chloroflexota bacterium]|nr:hydroxymethylpyrimidine/phosphomethylpyrimidine kinase [Chloroflexota bacterium]